MSTDADDPYNRGLSEFAARFESAAFEDVHAPVLGFLPERPGAVLDVGAGSGRDASWFAEAGWDVVAIEPAADMRSFGRLVHPHPRINWINDQLPSLEATHRLGQTFDLIWLSAVWMHVAPRERARAFRKLVTLLRPGGRLMISLRHGLMDLGRTGHPVSAPEIERLAAHHGLQVLLVREQADALGRLDVTWTTVVLGMPDDTTGALPLIRGIILNDRKTSTYKLALLRIIARIGDGAAGFAEPADDDHVRLPLGLVALYWLRAFKPLIRQSFPQAGTDRGTSGLRFVKAPFLALDAVSPFDFRIGAVFTGSTADALRLALADAARTIQLMPATFLTYADGRPLLPTRFGRTPPRSHHVVLDGDLLKAYGELWVPNHLWLALRRLSVWIEPMLVAEWIRLIQNYAERRGRILATDDVAAALRWFDPVRETQRARARAEALLDAGSPIRCVWSHEPLNARTLDIDHCLPWSVWPCGDLWNLLPAHRNVNRHHKRDQIVSAELLQRSQGPISDWWQHAYLDASEALLPIQFWQEARGTLPLLDPLDENENFDGLFMAVDLQRLRLRHDQQLREWNGVGHT
ncbi:MAG: methyltransferase domain-containing protein [Woeseiaceae bacterium]